MRYFLPTIVALAAAVALPLTAQQDSEPPLELRALEPVGLPGPPGALVCDSIARAASLASATVGTVYELGVVDRPPRLRHLAYVEPPESLRASGGRATLTFVVDSLGRIVPCSATVTDASPPQAVGTILAMLAASHFSPGQVAGHPVAVLVQQTVRLPPRPPRGQ
jgi:hypothetical protein